MKLNELLRSMAAIATERQENARQPKGVKRPCRNRHTGERGITYLKGTGRYRAFAHRPFYRFVGTFPTVDLAVAARDQAELLTMRRLYEIAPELEDEDCQDAVQIKRHNRLLFSVVYVINGGAVNAECETFEDCLAWLKDSRSAHKI